MPSGDRSAIREIDVGADLQPGQEPLLLSCDARLIHDDHEAQKNHQDDARLCHLCLPARSFFCFSTIAATSASNFLASYTIPSLIVYLIPPTRSGCPVLSFRRRAPVPYSTFKFSSGF